nr:chromatin assembly protein, putative [Toxoplasma gondii RH]
MSVVNVTNIRLGNNPSPISSPFVFEICFEALTPLKEDIEWRVVYVGSAECEKKARKKEKLAALSSSGLPSHQSLADGERVEGDMDVEEDENAKKKEEGGGDYLLDSVMLGPIERGVLAFEFAVNAPDYTKMDPSSVVGMQAVLVCALYKQQEFMRIGYYLNNAYSDTVLRENPPDVPIYDKLVRCIVDEPRVTRFPIVWDEDSGVGTPEGAQAGGSTAAGQAVESPAAPEAGKVSVEAPDGESKERKKDARTETQETAGEARNAGAEEEEKEGTDERETEEEEEEEE